MVSLAPAGGCAVRRVEGSVRGAAHRAGAASARTPDEPETGRRVHGAPGAVRAPEAEVANDDGLLASRAGGPEPAPARVHGPEAQRGLGRGYDLPARSGRVSVPLRRPGPLLAEGCRLGDLGPA